MEDRHGQLWLGTSNGLARFQPDGKQIKNFGRSNGLRSLQFGLGSCARTSDGHILFGSADGLYYFDPDQVKSDTFTPPALGTTDVRVGGGGPVGIPVATPYMGSP